MVLEDWPWCYRDAMRLDGYDCGGFYDEMFAADGSLRPGYSILGERLRDLPAGEVARRQAAAERALYGLGITFNVYSDGDGTEKIFPFDIVPRIVGATEWHTLEAGLRQRITALNHFIDDVYHQQRVIAEGIVPRELIESSKGYLPQCRGLDPPGGIWCHVTGTDLVRDRDGKYYVLEDNLRCPSGVSYVLSNRAVMKRTLPQAFEASRVRPVEAYPSHLLETLQSCAPPGVDGTPTVVLLTPGRYNSAYYEHSFLAQQMGIELVEGSDLVVENGWVHMRTTRGLRRVDVVYRRIDDTFLDPKAFRADSLLGVPGIYDVYRQGRVTLCNAPGTGVADDKVLYTYVPDLIRFYLSEEPLLANVPTYRCGQPAELDHVLSHLPELVVKAAGESGGYGMLIGPASTQPERDEFATRLRAEPRNYIAQPVLGLSRVPTLLPQGPGQSEVLGGRHVDLRPYVLFGGGGQRPYVMPGGLTRVALREGSLVVNSSQGGGSKDTWVLYDDGGAAC